MKTIFCVIFSAMFLFASIVHAEIKTCTGVGDYVLSEDSPPGDIKSKAKMYAEQNALEQAGIFVSGLTVVKSHMVNKDEIITIVGGILKIIDTKFEIIPINDAAGIAKYRATVTAQVDTSLLDDAIKKWLNRDGNEKANLVEKNKSQQKTIEDLQKRIIELEKLAAKATTVQDKKEIQEKVSGIDNETLAAQKFDEGWNLYQNKNFDGAIENYNKAIELNPNYADAYNNRGIAYCNLQNYEQAIKDYNRAIKLNPNNAYAYNNRGIVYTDLKNYSQAISDFNKAIELNPNFAEAYNNRGNAYDDLKNYEQAMNDFNKAIKLNPNNAEAYNNRGNAYYHLKNYEQAISDYTQAIKLNPNDADAYNNLGSVYNDGLKMYDKAIEYYNKVIELSPRAPYVYYNLGLAYDRKGDHSKAKEYFAKARALGWKG